MSVFHFLGTIFGHFRPNATPRKWTTFLNTILRHLSQLHISFESAFALGPHIFFPFALGPHIFFRFALGPHIFFPGCTWAAHFFLVCKNCSCGLFPSRRFALVSLVKKVYLIAELSFSCLLATAVKKVLVAKYKFIGNIQAVATSPRSLNSVLKLRGNRDVEVESNRLDLERKYLWLTGSSSLSTTAAYTASKISKYLGFTKALLWALLWKKLLVYNYT